MMQWLAVRQQESPEWQRAAQFGDTYLYITADELLALGEQTQHLVDQYLDRQLDPTLRPPGARLVSYLHLAFPKTEPLGRPSGAVGGAPEDLGRSTGDAGGATGDAGGAPGDAGGAPGDAGGAPGKDGPEPGPGAPGTGQ
jgi:hypothetical protein